jgi:DNA polymerase alpha subunit A
LDLLASRFKLFKLSLWHKMSRLKRSSSINSSSSSQHGGILWSGRQLTLARVVCDSYLSTRELIRETTYDLQHLVEKILNDKREELIINDNNNNSITNISLKKYFTSIDGKIKKSSLF